MGDSPSEVILYRNKNPVEFLLLSDQDNSVSTHWFVPALPTTYIINQKGEVIVRVIGEYEWDKGDFLNEIKALIKHH